MSNHTKHQIQTTLMVIETYAVIVGILLTFAIIGHFLFTDAFVSQDLLMQVIQK